ncbi:MAG: nucleotidyltransferase domain-containing protein [Sphingomonas sp.]
MVAAREAPGFDPRVVAEIDARLDEVCARHRVAIPLAIESGSRAWGFPSPDSDYDCRFVFVRAAEDYLTPWPRRDVIETPLDALLDVNGWDLGKLIKLLLKGNAVAVEWLQSPLHYRLDPEFRRMLVTFAAEHGARDAIRRHYLHLGEGQWRRFASDPSIPAKKLFYALRPAAALRWLARHPEARIAPMHFPTLMAESDPPAATAAIVDALIEAKGQTRELGTTAIPTPIRDFVEGEYAEARQALANAPPIRLDRETKAGAEAIFRELVARYAPA